MEYRKSQELFDRLLKVMPGGNTRSITYYKPFPIGIARGEGCRIWDVDGNSYIDLVNNYTSLVHGHAAPRIVQAIVHLQAAGRVLPSSWLVEALQGILVRGEGLGALAAPITVLVATGVAGLGMNSLLFRWESTEPLDRRKLGFAIVLLALLLLAVAVLAPPLKMRHVGWGGATGP